MDQKQHTRAREYSAVRKIQKIRSFQPPPQFYESLQQNLQQQLEQHTQQLLENLDLTGMISSKVKDLIPRIITQEIATQIQPLAYKLQQEYQALQVQDKTALIKIKSIKELQLQASNKPVNQSTMSTSNDFDM